MRKMRLNWLTLLSQLCRGENPGLLTSNSLHSLYNIAALIFQATPPFSVKTSFQGARNYLNENKGIFH